MGGPDVQGDLFGPGSPEEIADLADAAFADESIEPTPLVVFGGAAPDDPSEGSEADAASVYDEDARNGFDVEPDDRESADAIVVDLDASDESAVRAEAGTQDTLFGDLDDFTVWRREWRGMPEFVQNDLSPWKSVVIHFESRLDLRTFAELIDQTLTLKTQSVWYPEAEIGRMTTKRYTDGGNYREEASGDGRPI